MLPFWGGKCSVDESSGRELTHKWYWHCRDCTDCWPLWTTSLILDPVRDPVFKEYDGK